MNTVEMNLDGLIGPTHNYAGLAAGNLPSASNAGAVSRPKRAALEGLGKMRAVRDLGLMQGVLPPMARPDLGLLRRLGFGGDDAAVLEGAAKESAGLLAACWSASSMWTANAATVSAGVDCADGRVHLTAANLVSHFHRAIEADTTTRVLRAVFSDEERFAVHEALPGVRRFADEGAANHVRFARTHGEVGVELFVWGFGPGAAAGTKFEPRQSLEASRAVVRLHGLSAERCVFARQSAEAIDAGVFHNDVISTGNGRVFLYHEQSFEETERVVGQIDERLDGGLIGVQAARDDFSLADAVASYVFNSQLVTVGDGSMVLVSPNETRDHPRVGAWVERVVADESNPIGRVMFMDVRESMRNGGGPACLRLRVVLDAAEQGAMHRGVVLTDGLYEALVEWVERWYPDEVRADDLRDHRLARRCLDAVDALGGILGLEGVWGG